MTRSCWGLVTRARLSCGRPRKLCHQQCTSSANMCASRRVWRCHSSQPLQRLTFRTSVIPGTQASSRSWQPCPWPPPRLENTPGRAGSMSKNTPSNGCHLAPQHYGSQDQDATDIPAGTSLFAKLPALLAQ
ncbi:hypothetical LOC301124, isoform CRA_a [Rattus norvegicus]|uniref:Hypothetical LOC301124, isoform CRA_a n=1 Tax=Rattus norvegicus TaxID=10116 RepID=A6KQW8_RAT|nr:hypothetical LOC301124, isoform CRA_a [Rattus norvegicus]|eukprot:NP_001128005.1 MICOS complex subunit MIC13 [Rattus norvegicus]